MSILPSEYIKIVFEDLQKAKRKPTMKVDLFGIRDLLNAIVIYLDAEFKLNDTKKGQEFQSVSGDVPGQDKK